MKTTVILFSIVGTVLALTVSCSKSNVTSSEQIKTASTATDSLVGRWKLTKIVYPDMVQNHPTINTNVDDQVYEFNTDKRFTLYKKGERVEEGAYAKTVNAIDKLNKEYIINFLNDSTISLYSLSANQKELTLSTRMPNYPRIADAPTYVFTKQ